MNHIDPFDTNSAFWAEMDDHHCPCGGSGWALRTVSFQECPIHYTGQLHPQSRDLLLDEPDRLREEERKSHLRWKIQQSKDKITLLQKQLKHEQTTMVALELELINRTPTTKMKAMTMPSDPVIEILDEDVIEG
jgi:hypothetical protein